MGVVIIYIFFFFLLFFPGVVFPLYLEIFSTLFTMQRIRIIVENAGFEPRTSASEVWCASYEPPYHLVYHVNCR